MRRAIDDDDELDEMATTLAGISFRGEHFWLDDVHMSTWDCPSCLLGEEGDCHVCEFFSPDECRLLRNPTMRDDVAMLFAVYREHREVLTEQWERKAQLHRGLVRALQLELRSHGRPLHASVIAQIIADRHPSLGATEAVIVKVLAQHPELFDRLAPAIYEAR
jgi:hypothetical protein